MRPIRILLTGFGPFPGAPYNPTPTLVERLMRLRRPAFLDIERIAHIFTVSYGAVDRDLPDLLAWHRPDAMLMFGLATRTPYVRIETRARNAVTQLWPDAVHTRVQRNVISRSESSRQFGGHTTRLQQITRAAGVDARLSRDAGSYLCNYMCWRALEASAANAPAISAFVHVPLIARDGGRWCGIPTRISMDELVDAGESMLMEMVALGRRVRINPVAN